MKDMVLYWLPVFMLPAGNILALFFGPITFDPRIFLFSLIGAVAEELFFRWQLLGQIFLPRIKPVLAVLLVSVLFAAMHLFNLRNGSPLPAILPQMFCAFCFSIWAGAVVWRKGSILIPLLAHVLLNATAVTEGTLIPVLAGMLLLADGILLMKGNGYEQQR